jgi:hypothetical protein
VPRPASRLLPLLLLSLALPACDALWGGDFGHDPDAAMARMHAIPGLFAPGELKEESVWEPGDGITHIRFMYAAAASTCAEPVMAKLCAETGAIRKTTGAKVEAWCHGTAPPTAVEVCLDARRRPGFTR